MKFNNFLAKNCKPSIYRALEKRVESQVIDMIFKGNSSFIVQLKGEIKASAQGWNVFIGLIGLAIVIIAIAILIYLAK